MMVKKTYLIVALVVILILFGIVFLGYSDNTVAVGDVNFKLPDGYHEGKLNKLGDVNLTNGSHSIFITKGNGNDLYKEVQKYEKYKKTENTTVTISSYKLGDKVVFKAVSDHDRNVVHYWFLKNNKVYSIYSLQENKNIDNLVADLINSI